MYRSLFGLQRSAQFVGPSAVHPHSLDTADADQLDAHIISAVFVVGKGDEFAGGDMQVLIPCHDFGDLGAGDGAVQTVGAKEQDVVGLKMVVGDFDVHKEI